MRGTPRHSWQHDCFEGEDGNNHVAQGSTAEDGAHRAAVFVLHRVEHQPLPGGEADPKPPLLPADFVAVHREARTLALHDVQRSKVRARRP